MTTTNLWEGGSATAAGTSFVNISDFFSGVGDDANGRDGQKSELQEMHV